MLHRPVLLTLASCLLVAASSHARAGGGGPTEGDPCAPQIQYMEKTIMVPQWSTEMKKVMVTQIQREMHERMVTYFRCVPETKQVTRNCTILVPETRKKVVNYTVCKPVIREVTRQCMVRIPHWTEKEVQCTVMVPHQETRQGVRRLCRMTTETVMRTVTRDCGHWETRMVQVPCRCCRTCCEFRVVCKRVWCPNIVTEEVPCTVCRPVWTEQPYTYTATVCKPEIRTRKVRVCNWTTEPRTRTVKVCDYETEVQSREVTYTVCVPQQTTKTYNVTVMKRVPEQRKVPYTVCVPVQVEKEVPVSVCHMVPKTIQVPVCTVPVCGGCNQCRPSW